MAFKFPNGAQLGISTAIAAALATTGVSAANPAVASGIVTGSIAEGDVLVVRSTDPLINNLATEAGAVTTAATDTAELAGLDTSDTDIYDFTGDTTTLAIASAFVDFTQQGDPTSSGGDPKVWTGTLLEDPTGREINIPYGVTAQTIELPLYYDPSLPWYAAAKKAVIKREALVLRVKLPDGDKLYAYGNIGFASAPSMQGGNPMGNKLTFTALSDFTLVPAA